MSYLVRLVNSTGREGWLKRGMVIHRREHATVYSSPSGARLARANFLERHPDSGYVVEVVGLRTGTPLLQQGAAPQ
jgi:hypothetical protein